MYFVYILECVDGSLYTGITNDLDRRLAAHRAGTASRYTAAKGAGNIVYVEQAAGRSEALRREAEIKSWRRQRKIAHIEGTSLQSPGSVREIGE